jgi:uncharacterized membrane protein
MSLTAPPLNHPEDEMNYSAPINLDLLPLGWVHFIASLAALAAGILVLLRTKGTPVHRLTGRIYALAILVTSFTALGIYRLGSFFFAHWFAVAAVISTLIGLAAVHFRIPRVGWMHLHLTCMLVSFDILIGGAVNEVFLRVNFLHRLVPNLSSPAVGATHFAVILFFAGLIAYFNAVILIRSRPPGTIVTE